MQAERVTQIRFLEQPFMFEPFVYVIAAESRVLCQVDFVSKSY